jgi:hypothetical protein
MAEEDEVEFFEPGDAVQARETARGGWVDAVVVHLVTPPPHPQYCVRPTDGEGSFHTSWVVPHG